MTNNKRVFIKSYDVSPVRRILACAVVLSALLAIVVVALTVAFLYATITP